MTSPRRRRIFVPPRPMGQKDAIGNAGVMATAKAGRDAAAGAVASAASARRARQATATSRAAPSEPNGRRARSIRNVQSSRCVLARPRVLVPPRRRKTPRARSAFPTTCRRSYFGRFASRPAQRRSKRSKPERARSRGRIQQPRPGPRASRNHCRLGAECRRLPSRAVATGRDRHSLWSACAPHGRPLPSRR